MKGKVTEFVAVFREDPARGRQILLDGLRRTGGDILHAAANAGVTRRNYLKIVQKYHLEDDVNAIREHVRKVYKKKTSLRGFGTKCFIPGKTCWDRVPVRRDFKSLGLMVDSRNPGLRRQAARMIVGVLDTSECAGLPFIAATVIGCKPRDLQRWIRALALNGTVLRITSKYISCVHRAPIDFSLL